MMLPAVNLYNLSRICPRRVDYLPEIMPTDPTEAFFSV